MLCDRSSLQPINSTIKNFESIIFVLLRNRNHDTNFKFRSNRNETMKMGIFHQFGTIDLLHSKWWFHMLIWHSIDLVKYQFEWTTKHFFFILRPKHTSIRPDLEFDLKQPTKIGVRITQYMRASICILNETHTSTLRFWSNTKDHLINLLLVFCWILFDWCYGSVLFAYISWLVYKSRLSLISSDHAFNRNRYFL